MSCAVYSDMCSTEHRYVSGVESWISSNQSLIPSAVAAARTADIVIAVVGDGDRTCGEAQDRVHLDLPGAQPELLTALAGSGTPVVAVLITGRPVTFERTPGLVLRLGALVAAWRPGAQGGPALWALLKGEENFSGSDSAAWARTLTGMCVSAFLIVLFRIDCDFSYRWMTKSVTILPGCTI